MRKLGPLPLAIKSKQYEVSFSYATPKELDIFALVMLKAIESRELQVRGATLETVLIELGFSKELHRLFESRLRQMISLNLINYARCMPIPIGNALKDKNINRQMIEVVKAIIADISAKSIAMTALALTGKGETAISEMKFLSEEKYGNVTVVVHGITGVIKLQSEMSIRKDSEDVLLIERDEITSTAIEIETEIESNKINRKWTKDGNGNTKIFDTVINQTGDTYISSSIDIIENEGNLCFGGEDEEDIASLIASIYGEDDNKRISKFVYIDEVSHEIDYDKAKLFGQSNTLYRGVVVLESARDIFTAEIKNDDSTVYDVIAKDCLMIGVQKSDESGMVVRYSSQNVCGVIIPIINEYSTRDIEGMIIFEELHAKVIKEILRRTGRHTSLEMVNYMYAITPAYLVEALDLKLVNVEATVNR